MSYVLDEATQLTRQSERSYTANADPRFLNVRGMFGGWVAALTCAGIEADDHYRGAIIGHTVNFHQAVDLEEVSLEVALVDQRRRLDFWEVDLRSQSGQSLAHAMVVSGLRSPTEMTYESQAPERRAAADCIALPRSPQAPAWFSHYDMRLAKGRPFQRNDAPVSTTYIRESDGRPLDQRSLLAIADTPMPRPFFCRDGAPTFAPTLTLSTHIYATDAQFQEAGSEYCLLDVGSRVLRASLCNQETAIFSHTGVLLATSYQTGFFRDD